MAWSLAEDANLNPKTIQDFSFTYTETKNRKNLKGDLRIYFKGPGSLGLMAGPSTGRPPRQTHEIILGLKGAQGGTRDKAPRSGHTTANGDETYLRETQNQG